MRHIERVDPINIAISEEQCASVIEYNFVVWADKNVSKIIGVTFDKKKGKPVNNRNLLKYLIEEITSKNLPLLLIEHSFDSNSIEVVDCNIDRNHKYEISSNDLEGLISTKFGISSDVNSDRIKSVNVADRVSDGFHNWSRKTFGAKIKKTDIDCLLFKDRVRATIEVKNTSRSGIPIKAWSPYYDDQDNYKIVGLFSEKFLCCDFITLHHTLKNNVYISSENIDLGVWVYNSSLSFDQFRSDANRKMMKFSQVLNNYL